MSGPISAPPTPPVDRVPSAQPLRLRGTWVAISALALGMNPPSRPSTARRAKLPDRLRHAHQYHDDRHAQCGAQQHQFTAASVGQGTQNGAAIAENRKVMLNSRPDHMLSA